MADVTITLGGIELDPDLRWVERRQSQRVAQSEQVTLGGGLNVLAAGIGAGIPITLQGGDDFGWVKTPIVESMQEMADDPGAVYELEIVSGLVVETYSVIFSDTRFEARALVERVIPDSDDDFIVTIKLKTI